MNACIYIYIYIYNMNLVIFLFFIGYKDVLFFIKLINHLKNQFALEDKPKCKNK